MPIDWNKTLTSPLFWGGLGILGADPRQGMGGLIGGASQGIGIATGLQEHAANQKLRERQLKELEDREKREQEKLMRQLELEKAQAESWKTAMEAYEKATSPESEGGPELTHREKRGIYSGIAGTPGIGNTFRAEAFRGMLESPPPPKFSYHGGVQFDEQGNPMRFIPKLPEPLLPTQQKQKRLNELTGKIGRGEGLTPDEQAEYDAIIRADPTEIMIRRSLLGAQPAAPSGLANPPVPTGPQPSGQTVRMRNSAGRVINVPAHLVEEAKKDGFMPF